MNSFLRILNALKADMLFQFKQGFYFVYLFLGVLYVIVCSQFSEAVVRFVLPIALYTDPSILGLFFIGGILLLEKEQGILALVYVTPLRTWEFILSKVISLGFVSLVASIGIALAAYKGPTNYFLLIFSVILTSWFYTLVGFIIATKSKSVNDFFVKIIPLMIVLILPCIPAIIFPNLFWLSIIPSVSSLRLVWGAYHGISLLEVMVSSAYLILIGVIFFRKTQTTFQNTMITQE
jgi:fluoroquinolone transport system permease protein